MDPIWLNTLLIFAIFSFPLWKSKNSAKVISFFQKEIGIVLTPGIQEKEEDSF